MLAVSSQVFTCMVLVVFLAGLVRGYSGFGFSALVLLLEAIASLSLLPAVWRPGVRQLGA